MKNFYDVIIIGGGAAALMCGAHLKKEFLILEGSEKAAKKMSVSGGGKCNFTNEQISVDNYAGDKEFIASALDIFGYEEIEKFVNRWKVPFEVRKNRQLFCKNSAQEIVSALLQISKGKIALNTKLVDARFEKNIFILNTTNGVFECNKLVIASGGVSYPLLGATDIGYKVAQSFGHSVNTPKPALVGFTVQPSEFWFKELSGLSVAANVSVGSKSFKESVLFAHKGVSGPAILNASLYWEKGSIAIDFLPDTDLDALCGSGSKQITTQLGVPKRFSKAFLDSVGLADKIVDKLTKEDKEKLSRLKNYEFAPAGTFGFSKAEITKGGVSTEYIDPSTMGSKLRKSLYFIGEALDVNGELGGYNFHWAFASAVSAARTINNS